MTAAGSPRRPAPTLPTGPTHGAIPGAARWPNSRSHLLTARPPGRTSITGHLQCHPIAFAGSLPLREWTGSGDESAGPAVPGARAAFPGDRSTPRGRFPLPGSVVKSRPSSFFLPQPSPRGQRPNRLPQSTGDKFTGWFPSIFATLLAFNKRFLRAWRFLQVLKSLLLAASKTHLCGESVLSAAFAQDGGTKDTRERQRFPRAPSGPGAQGGEAPAVPVPSARAQRPCPAPQGPQCPGKPL